MAARIEVKVTIILIVVALMCSLFAIQIAQATDYDLQITSPHKNYQYNYKGSLHVHSLGTPDTPTEVGEWYRDNGYTFYSITDHDFLTPDPSVAGVTFLGTSEEDTCDGSLGHMGQINISSAINSGTTNERIAEVLGMGGFSIFNHANREVAGHSLEELYSSVGGVGIEVFNSKSGTDSTILWDKVRTYTDEEMYAFATDDSHNMEQRSRAGRGFIVVNGEQENPSKDDIITQIKAGNFYASRGYSITVNVSGKTINASTDSGVKFKWITRNGKILKETSGNTSSFSPEGYEKYVRIEVYDVTRHRYVWSQPIIVSGDNYKPKTYALSRRTIKAGRKTALYWKITVTCTDNCAHTYVRIKKRVGNSWRTIKYYRNELQKINVLRKYNKTFPTRGTYRYLIYCQDQARNRERNVGTNYIFVK